jgi:FkbM family methyltransferase
MRFNNFKHGIKKAMPKTILDFLSKSHFFREITGIGYFGLSKLDKKIAPYLPKRDGYYVELGANDGITQSNTYHFEKYKNYSGILIEPIPQKFTECKNNRSTRNHFINCACVSFNHKKSTMELVYSNLMTTSLEGDSDILERIEHAKSGQHLIKDEIYKFVIQAKTLNEILIEVDAPQKINFLSLDVEGSEIEVLGGIDFERYDFGLMCIESRDFPKLQDFLTSKGYIFFKKISIHDYLFKVA